jgi:hypothetical protein
MQSIPWLLSLCLLVSSAALAEEITIFDMRKSLAMADDEPTFRDFYLSKGGGSGLRPGMIVTVKRRLPLYDSFHNRSAGDMTVSVGRVKIIHVERDVSVARQHSQFAREDMPLLEDNFIMVGDEVDLSSATTESKSKEKKAATVEPVEKAPDTASIDQNSVDFASKGPDKSAPGSPSIDGPVVQ